MCSATVLAQIIGVMFTQRMSEHHISVMIYETAAKCFCLLNLLNWKNPWNFLVKRIQFL